MELQGKVAVITGAGSGIGAATVRRLINKGVFVFAADISNDRLNQEFSNTENVETIALDVSDSKAVNALFQRVNEKFGRLDMLLNGAGINAPTPESNQKMVDTNVAAVAAIKRGEVPKFDFIEDTSDEDFRRVMEINLFSQFYCIRAAVPLMKANGGGAIVNISSVAALTAPAMPLYYPASKAGVLGLTRGASAELAPYNIRVNAVAPAGVDTPLLREQPPEVVEFLLSSQPIKRAAKPDELARTIVFLLNEKESGFYTGQTISPNGGTHV